MSCGTKVIVVLFALLLLPLAYYFVMSGQALIALGTVCITIVLLGVTIFGGGAKNNRANTIIGKGDINAPYDVHHKFRKDQLGTAHRDKDSRNWLKGHDREG